MGRDKKPLPMATRVAAMRGDTIAVSTRALGMSGATDYVLCGWRVRSSVPLPDAMAWCGDDRSPDVTISFGAAPSLIDPVWYGTGPVQVGRDGVCRLGIDHVAWFIVSNGREVVIEPRGGIDTPEFRSWLLGAVLGMLCHQRGLFPLHASCIRIGDGAVALAGRTGAGSRPWRLPWCGAATPCSRTTFARSMRQRPADHLCCQASRV